MTRTFHKRWPHNPNDETTWKYSGFKIIDGTEKNPRMIRWILNRDFRFMHLLPMEERKDETVIL